VRQTPRDTAPATVTIVLKRLRDRSRVINTKLWGYTFGELQSGVRAGRDEDVLSLTRLTR